MPYFSRMSVTFFKNGLKWLGYMYIKGFGVELASYQNFKSNMVSGKCGSRLAKNLDVEVHGESQVPQKRGQLNPQVVSSKI